MNNGSKIKEFICNKQQKQGVYQQEINKPKVDPLYGFLYLCKPI